MGHTSKFTFPLPGRKQRQTQITISGPLNKVQKILGSAEINIDSPTDSNEQLPPLIPPPAKQWETMSNSANSGISISVSESTNSYGEGDGGTIVGRGIGSIGGPEWPSKWDDESAIIPARFDGAMSLATSRATDDYTAETSSLRRRPSNSTITSFYDKSKQPLSISQQTSNSAMAKGLPQKAQALLDMGGDVPTKSKARKKLSRLDMSFSHLLPKSRSSRHADSLLGKGFVLGADMITRSPSAMSIVPEMTLSSPLRQEEKPMMETVREPPNGEKSYDLPRSRFQFHKQAPAPLKPARTQTQAREQAQAQEHRGQVETGRIMRHKSSAKELESLYEHYERRTMQELLEKGDIERLPHADAAGGGSRPAHNAPDYPTPPTSSSTQAMLFPTVQATNNRGALNRPPSSLITAPDTPTGSAIHSLGPNSAPDCGASVSSRHTRTSKASRRTDPSMTEFDLQKTSVLSLSSDSEDEFVAPRPATSLSVPANPSSRSSEVHSSPKSLLSAVSSAQDKPYLTIPQTNSSISSLGPPKILPRKSSLTPSVVATSSHLPAAMCMSSKLSSVTGTNANSKAVSKGVNNIPPSTHSLQESRIISMIPARVTPSPRPAMSLDGLNIRAAQAARTSEQPTPPLSPTSVDFYLQSQRGSVAGTLDNDSIRSGPSAGAGGSRRRSSVGSNNGRIMAVTRQEEMLLAALRMKRARMRESMIAEFDEDQLQEEPEGQAVAEDVLQLLQQQHRQQQQQQQQQLSQQQSSQHQHHHQHHQHQHQYQHQHQRHQTQDNSGPIGPIGIHGTTPSRHSSVSTVVALNTTSHSRSYPQIRVSADINSRRDETPMPTSTRTALGPPPRPSRPPRPPRPQRSSEDLGLSGSERGQILVMLDHPVEGVDPRDAAGLSSDLNEYLRFEDRSAGSSSPAMQSLPELARSVSTVTEGTRSTSSEQSEQPRKIRRHRSPTDQQRLSLSAFPAPVRGNPPGVTALALEGRHSRSDSPHSLNSTRSLNSMRSLNSLNMPATRPRNAFPATTTTSASVKPTWPTPPPLRPLPMLRPMPTSTKRQDDARIRVVQNSPAPARGGYNGEDGDDDDDDDDGDGVPRPDSPISPPLAMAKAAAPLQKAKENAQLRLSAVGGSFEGSLRGTGW